MKSYFKNLCLNIIIFRTVSLAELGLDETTERIPLHKGSHLKPKSPLWLWIDWIWGAWELSKRNVQVGSWIRVSVTQRGGLAMVSYPGVGSNVMWVWMWLSRETVPSRKGRSDPWGLSTFNTCVEEDAAHTGERIVAREVKQKPLSVTERSSDKNTKMPSVKVTEEPSENLD